ncbi:glycosyltransferase [Saccharibacillus sp. CPCC 101409]|uniref:glycosyltransferase family 32 protein n=1 Tax=Saccharibacillus sp. CPCC 101409 TaxID=3058041 RepID=UPI00267219C3|nr:glycosyltransferase [Saccharibacillus sp. CPCC 101409]MDO3409404.1 glycosyltransferase [Saccharibacillus sp. CPCC 101409]
MEQEHIPKIIHYCWFGRGELPELAVKCIESWKTYLPDYKIVRWDEDSFDIESNLFVRQAYKARKFAFVSDYVRLYALYTQGGIYMDTDLQVLKSLDPFLHHEAFSGFETPKTIPTAVMGAKAGSPVMHAFLDYYTDRSFIKPDGNMDITTNVKIITEYCLSRGFEPNNEYQVFEGFALYPKNVFSPMDWNPDKEKIADKPIPEESYTVHHFAGSWLSEKDIRRSKSLLWRKFGRQIGFALRMTRAVVGDKAYAKIKQKYGS